jgi:hypothetical protein
VTIVRNDREDDSGVRRIAQTQPGKAVASAACRNLLETALAMPPARESPGRSKPGRAPA